ncbi:sugar phosphate isomerase/epimerase family protein [Pedosphaera parvula]|uniref:Xylose isomerase domain protein TIM barrel n=1 Tax=Pedosphaera parvula (strain Ellin514) TaxID=320771 RepID=B9XRI0_PEDPL|nr:sugar phosphate isomerase/epimerase [Pedosphaera parvula]EEF57551.1 Xylose isomerase domain protein TIM barrel [Pedosphaera parvula Ellin514]
MKQILSLGFCLLFLALCHAEPSASTASNRPAITDSDKVGGFALGCQAYSFRENTLFEAIDKTKACGGKVIEIYTWQKLSPGTGNVEVNANLSDANIKLIREKLDAAGIKLVNAYVGNANFVKGSKDEKSPRKVFEWARKMGLRGLTGEPPEDQLDIIEKLAKEYDIQFCLHNHKKEPEKPEYKNWDPHYTLSLIKNRDHHIGACVDTGHLVRSGIKPVEALKILQGRVLFVHLKDMNEWGPKAMDQPYGTGVSDIKAILNELKRQNFNGHISIEYENTTDHLLDDIKKCVDYVRAEGPKS